MKLYLIECCEDCPSFQSEYYGTMAKCLKTGKYVKPNPDIDDFPKSCPLIDYDYKINDGI